jgi:hypothetical protein
MDLTPLQPWLKFLHVAGGFMFVAGHGVSMAVALRLRGQRDPARMLALLDLSGASLGLTFAGLLTLFFAGIAGGIIGGYFGRAWIWIGLVLLIVIASLMTPLASRHFTELRRALGQRTRDLKPGDPDPVPLSPEAVAALAAGRWPEQAALIGGGGFLVILWLMMFKPF